MPYILSPEQKVVVDALTSKTTSTTKYFDVISAMQSISKGCAIALNDGKKILFHIPDEETKNLLKSIFAENGLDDLAIDIADNKPMPELDIIKLRSTLKKERDSDAIINYVLANKKAKKLEKQVTGFYKAFDAKVMADSPFRDFATSIIYHKSKIQSSLNITTKVDDQLQFTATEYYKVKKEISHAQNIYQRQYELFDHLALFKEGLWNGIENTKIEEIKNLLQEFRIESSQLAKDFTFTSNQLTKSSALDLTNTFSTLEQKFSIHEEACLSIQIKSENEIEKKDGVFSLFKKKKSSPTNKIYVEAFDELSGVIQSISQEWFDELDSPTSEMITYEYIIEFIEKNAARASFYKDHITKNLHNSVQRINKINTSSQEVIKLDKRLESFILKMNSSELFDLELEHNILSFVKQSDLAENIAEYIEKCHILFHSSSLYIEWKSFYDSSDIIFRLIFDELKRHSKNTWIDSFENWYQQKIKNNVLGSNTITQKELADYFGKVTNTNQNEISALIANLHQSRIASAEELKLSTKELYSTLFKKKQMPNISWYNTSLMNRAFMQSFFPIHISNSMSYSNEYDMVISFSRKEESTESKYHYFSPIESKDIQNISDNKDNFLYLNDYRYKVPLIQLSSTDKLKASKKLAKYILSLNHQIKIYQLKSANIISLLPSYDDSYLERELDKINVKVIDTNGVLYDRLTESILFTDRKPFLIIKDELINSELHDHILWQLKTIQLFQDMGYEIISLNTLNQLEDNELQFKNLLHKIGGQQTEKEVLEINKTDNSKMEAEEA